MKEFWYWTELIGFDKDASDCGVSDFIGRIPAEVSGINLLLYSIDFVNTHRGMDEEYRLGNGVCSYRGHPYNAERKIQKWTNYDLKRLIGNLQAEKIRVVFSYFNFYDYFDDDGHIVSDGFSRSHPELREQRSDGEPQSFLSPIKRFADGRYYEDYLAHQTEHILKDYGFDGVVLADGISSPRLSLQSGDCSDDLINQFLSSAAVDLPEKFRRCSEKVSAGYAARHAFIFENMYPQWAAFISSRYASFIKKQADVTEKAGKILLVNSVWTRDPFESLYRYGIDYRQIVDPRVYALMVEDCGATMALLSDEQLCCDSMPQERRRYCNYEFLYAEMALKAALPETKQLSMTSLKDTLEDWNVIQEGYPEFKKSVLRRSGAYIWKDGAFRRCSDGSMFCLSDAIDCPTWNTVHRCEEQSDMQDFLPCGITALYISSISAEVAAYAESLKSSSSKTYYDLLCGGCQINCMTEPKELTGLERPVVAADLSFYGEEELSRMEDYPHPLFVFGTKKMLKKEPSLILGSENGKLYCFCYRLNAGQKERLLVKAAETGCFSETEYRGEIVRADLSPRYSAKKRRLSEPALYTQELVFGDTCTDLLRNIAPALNAAADLPESVGRDECKYALYKKGDLYRLFVYNDEYRAASVKIRMPFAVKNVRAVTKAFWYAVGTENGVIGFTLNARSAEILEFTNDTGGKSC